MAIPSLADPFSPRAPHLLWLWAYRDCLPEYGHHRISLAFGRPMAHLSASSNDIEVSASCTSPEDPDCASPTQHREKSILASASPGLSALPQSSDGLKLQSFRGWQ